MVGNRFDAAITQARRESVANHERRRVVAVEASPRARKLGAAKWVYVAVCGRECVICDERVRV